MAIIFKVKNNKTGKVGIPEKMEFDKKGTFISLVATFDGKKEELSADNIGVMASEVES